MCDEPAIAAQKNYERNSWWELRSPHIGKVLTHAMFCATKIKTTKFAEDLLLRKARSLKRAGEHTRKHTDY